MSDLMRQLTARQAAKELVGFLNIALAPPQPRSSAGEMLKYSEMFVGHILSVTERSEVIMSALGYLKTEWTSTRWPTFAQMTGILREIEDTHSFEGRAAPPEPENEERMLDRLWDSDAGRQAVQHGYCVEFQVFCRDKKRVPTDEEARNLYRAQIRFERKTPDMPAKLKADAVEAKTPFQTGLVAAANLAFQSKWALENRLRRDKGRWLKVEHAAIGELR